MTTAQNGSDRLRRRVADAAEAALARQKFVAPVDVLTGLGWIHPVNVEAWRRGRIEYLESMLPVGPETVAAAIELLREWAEAEGLEPSEGGYPARSRAHRDLQFSAAGDPEIERVYRTHWLSPGLSPAERPDHARAAERQAKPPLVISPTRGAFTCSVCNTEGAGLLTMDDSGPVCMSCADMDHLVFLPRGDAALTRRAKAASRLSAVVVRFSRARRRYERQGILVEEGALERAEAECLADEEARARRRERESLRRADQDLELHARLAEEIVRVFPGCPPERATEIARHTGARGSGRVGRSAAGRALDPTALELAVAATVRHEDTGYDELLMSGLDRETARAAVRDQVLAVLDAWRASADISRNM